MAPKNKTIGIIVVNYGNDRAIDYLCDCLERQDCKDFDVYIRDNNYDNIGYGAGVNFVYKDKKRMHKYMLICNNDIAFSMCFIRDMIDCLEKTSAAVVVPSINGALSWRGEFIDGCCFAVRTSRFETIFDEDYFLYYEDVDFSCRVRKMLYRVVMCKSAIVYHKQNQTSPDLSHYVRYYQGRNFLMCMHKNLSAGAWIFCLLKFWICFFPKRVIYFALKGKFNTICYFLMGINDFFLGKVGQCLK